MRKLENDFIQLAVKDITLRLLSSSLRSELKAQGPLGSTLIWLFPAYGTERGAPSFAEASEGKAKGAGRRAQSEAQSAKRRA